MKFRTALLASIFLSAFTYIVSILVYPETEILPLDFFFAIVVIQLFFLWFDDVKEKYRIIEIQKKKEEFDERKAKLSLITSHELQAPITVIKGYINLLMDKTTGELTEEEKKALNIMDKYSTSLEEIKNNLTKLFLGALPSFEQNLRLSSIETLIRTIADDIMPFIKKKNQELSLEIEKEIPQVMMDRSGIGQVLMNLLLNAIKFTPDKGRIIIRVKDDKDNIRVEVEDNGVGISKYRLGSIFGGSCEVRDTDKPLPESIEFKSKEAGLGLTTAKSIVDAHKGKIWVESEINEFSRFIFTIPKLTVSRFTFKMSEE